MSMKLQTATKILECALKTPTPDAVNALKAGLFEIESLALELRNGQLRLLLSKVYALGLPGAPAYERAYAYVLASWATEHTDFDTKFELANEQQYWEVTLTTKQQDRAAELLSSLLAKGEHHKHTQGNPFNGSWYGYYDDPTPNRPGSPKFRRAYDKWLTAMRIEPRPDSSLVKRQPNTMKAFKWSDNWETEIVECPRCEWQGTIKMDWDGTFETGYDYMDQEFYFMCPKCPRDVHLARITLASPEEAREHWDELSTDEKNFYAKRIERETKRIEHEAKELNGFLEALPKIEADPLILVWDIEFDGGSNSVVDSYTTIKYEGQVIWRERAHFECLDRFNEVVKVLRQKYGDRLKALIPTRRSETFLYGDIISPSCKTVDISTSFPILGIEALAMSGDEDALNHLRDQR